MARASCSVERDYAVASPRVGNGSTILRRWKLSCQRQLNAAGVLCILSTQDLLYCNTNWDRNGFRVTLMVFLGGNPYDVHEANIDVESPVTRHV